MKVWVLFLENVEGENGVELYSTYEKVHKAFENYANESRNMEEFAECDDCISWFDPTYNSNSSFIYIISGQEVY